MNIVIMHSRKPVLSKVLLFRSILQHR